MRDNSFSKTLIIFSFLLLGVPFVVYMGESTKQYLLSAVVLLAVAAFVIAARVYLSKQKRTLGTINEAKESSEVGFVVDTFHELVAKLKEKEKELEKLKGFAEEKAVSIEAYNENILQSVPSGVISIDNSLKIKSMNQAAERILGVDSDEAISRDFKDVFNEPLTSLIMDDEALHRKEYSYVTNDKRHIWLGITTSRLINTTGEKIGLIFIFTDLTDVKAMQAQIELKQRLSQLGEMSAGISHELRNSMSVISGYAKLLGKKVDKPNKPTVDAIVAEISSMDKVISELLAFAKPTVLNTDRVDLNNIIEETVKTVFSGNDSVNVSINATETVFCRADDVLIKQALSNLFINSIDALPSGGNIDIELNRLRDKAELSIRDNGSGIPEEIVRKIFLPFFTTRQEGVGLGLALVQKIIVGHGWSIEVSSKDGAGTSFLITIPSVE